jgi:hypothetical protein
MREALIICPLHDNSGHDLASVCDSAVRSLVSAFGGCTLSNAFGHWRNDRGHIVSEPVWQLVSACTTDEASRAMLRSVALMILHTGRQDAVYLRYPHGDVEFVTGETA